MEFDLESIKNQGYDIVSPVVVTNVNDYSDSWVLSTPSLKNNLKEFE